MEIVILWIVFLVVVGVMASNRGRTVWGWVLLSGLLISPLLGIICLLVAGYANRKTCPRCAEHVKDAACVCRHCGHEFKTQASYAATLPPAAAPLKYRHNPNTPSYLSDPGPLWNPTPSEDMARRFPYT